MQTSGQYGEVPQFVGRVPAVVSVASAASAAQAHSHMFSMQQDSQMVNVQKIRLESDSQEAPPSKQLNNTTNNSSSSNTDSFNINKQLVPANTNEQQQQQQQIGAGGGGGGGGEEDVLDCERGSVGNRWPRQETLALLKIRSEMDANFKDASLKGPLWEDVSRRLAELGYYRNAKKCKEKFENVHKYYKRTKEGRAGRQDGKSYKFFSQLEALYGNTNSSNHGGIAGNDGNLNNNNNKVTVAIGGGVGVSATGSLPAAAPISTREIMNTASTVALKATMTPMVITNPTSVVQHRPATGGSMDFSAAAAAFNFSSGSSSEEEEYDDPEESEQTNDQNTRKRKRSSMMAFFENLMKQVIEKQEAMQQKFLEAIEKREQDRMIREEAWKRQEMARLSREQELKSQERSLTASRDAAMVAFLQKVTGQTLQIPQLPSPIQHQQNIISIPPPPPPPPPQNHQISDQEPHNQECKELAIFDPNSKRWPKPEVLALIKLRSGLEHKFHEAGPKGPLWEEISSGMACLGYNRNAKRCKEKWENINKYFRKAKESNKKRPENAKTCPYFHQLDALYRKKTLGNPGKQNKMIMEQDLFGREGGGGGGGGQDQQNKMMQEDHHNHNLIEQNLQQQQRQACESSREDKGHGDHAAAGSADMLPIMPPPPGSEAHAVTYHHERTNSSTPRDTSSASFMAMVHKLGADPPEFNMSTSSNTE
ncbi:hypothetical protein SUGI_0976580 [Cryptomeria japonica]|uniref:trihelix transcription factor GTL1 n=1 Tax=Cryptomeria japonica TaxID=3369 RepID=UPI0024148586|nr:trihelix transcription factor GTL1 [Cryptomeria japonica]GLJ46336.1 hypothetical protein SUGI_0976580 [Cryptomeria japonica]